jgi:hypothetical protein
VIESLKDLIKQREDTIRQLKSQYDKISATRRLNPSDTRSRKVGPSTTGLVSRQASIISQSTSAGSANRRTSIAQKDQDPGNHNRPKYLQASALINQLVEENSITESQNLELHLPPIQISLEHHNASTQRRSLLNSGRRASVSLNGKRGSFAPPFSPDEETPKEQKPSLQERLAKVKEQREQDIKDLHFKNETELGEAETRRKEGIEIWKDRFKDEMRFVTHQMSSKINLLQESKDVFGQIQTIFPTKIAKGKVSIGVECNFDELDPLDLLPKRPELEDFSRS